MVRYEDFVENPVPELKRICNSIMEPFSPDSLIIQKMEEFNWEPDPHLSSQIVSKTEKIWRDHLSILLAKKIESSLGTIMKDYGFNFYTKNNNN